MLTPVLAYVVFMAIMLIYAVAFFAAIGYAIVGLAMYVRERLHLS
jgi:hypothetical protein